MKKIFSLLLTIILVISLTPGITASADTLTLEDVMTQAVAGMEPTADISSFGLEWEGADCEDVLYIRQTFQNVHNNNPYFFYLDLAYQLHRVGKNITKIEFTYNYTADEVDDMTAEMDAVVNTFINHNITSSMSDFEKELAVHDYIVLNTEYVNTERAPEHTAYGALVDGKAVCEGYSLAFSLIMNKLSVPCTMISSEKMNHAWNVVRIDGKWYHTDVTWADPVPDVKGRVNYYYFNCSSAYFKNPSIPTSSGTPLALKPHTWDEELYAKYTADSDKYSYIHSIEQSTRTNQHFYYFDRANFSLSKIPLTGGTPVVLKEPLQPLYTCIYEDTLYFSNYTYRGQEYFLCSIKLDGTNMKTLIEKPCKYLYIDNGILHYYLEEEDKRESIKLGSSRDIEVNTAYFTADGHYTEEIPDDCDSLTAHITLTNKSEITDFDVRFLAASYTPGGRLSGINVKTVALPAGANHIMSAAPVALPDNASEAKIFAFVNLKPIMDPVSVK